MYSEYFIFCLSSKEYIHQHTIFLFNASPFRALKIDSFAQEIFQTFGVRTGYQIEFIEKAF